LCTTNLLTKGRKGHLRLKREVFLLRYFIKFYFQEQNSIRLSGTSLYLKPLLKKRQWSMYYISF
jgi:hypothetical protein